MKKIALTLFICLLVPFLFACDSKDDENSYTSFKDHTGETVTLDSEPKRVAVLFSSFADVWKTAGGDVAITVGESIERGFANEDTLLVDSGAGKTVNTELLISYKPDFVICSADVPAQVECAKILRVAGIPCAVMRIESFEDYLYTLDVFTDITENKNAYKKYGNGVKNQIKNILDGVPNDNEKPRILFVRAGSTARSTKAKNAEGNFVCKMLDELGTYNIADNAKILLDGLSTEEILREDPDFIFISTMGDEKAAKENMEKLLLTEAYSSLTAVKSGNVYYLPKDMFQYKPNSRWADAYAYLVEILYEN